MSAWVWILGWITICSMGMFGAAFAGYGRWKHVDRLVGGFFGLMVFGVLMLMVIAARAEEVETIIKVKESQELRAIYSDGDQWSGGFLFAAGSIGSDGVVYRYYYYDEDFEGYLYGEIEASSVVIRVSNDEVPRIDYIRVQTRYETTPSGLLSYHSYKDLIVIYVPEGGLIEDIYIGAD